MSVFVRGLLLICCCSFTVASTAAELYPSKPIRLIVPLAPGGGNDIIARILGKRMTTRFDKQVIVDNRPGIDGVVGTDFVAKSKPDGYTLLWVSGNHAINVAVGRKLPYDAIADFAPIAQTAVVQFAIVVHPSLPVHTVKELIALAKARPGDLNYATSSKATQLPQVLFNQLTNIKMVHVPYKGSAPAVVGLLSGESHLMVASIAGVLQHVNSGKLRAIAVGDIKRSALMPDIPTIRESGVSEYRASGWFAMLAPAGIPADIIRILNAEVTAGIQAQEIREKMQQLGVEPYVGSPEELAKLIASEVVLWSKVAKSAGLTESE